MTYITLEKQDGAKSDISYQERSSRRTGSTRLHHLITLVSVIAPSMFVPACATPSAVVGNSNIQAVLVQARFKSKPARTAQQRQRLQSLPEHQFTTVNQNGPSFYVWADKRNNRLYCGNDQAFHSYKELRREQKAREAGAITYIDEPRGTSVPVTVFYGFEPFSEWFR